MAKPSEIKGLHARTPMRKAGPRLIAARLADVRRYEGVLSNGVDESSVHDTRVAANRLRNALNLFGGWSGAKLERKVKRLQDALGGVRDLQVQLAWLEKQKNLANAEGIRMLLAQQRAALLEKERDLRLELERWIRKSAPKLEKQLEQIGGKGRLGGRRMRRELRKGLQQVKRRLRAVQKAWSPPVIHNLRIQMKRLRYAAELLSYGLEKQTDAILKTVAPIQKQLGDLHDTDVRLSLLSAFGQAAKGRWKIDLQRAARTVASERHEQLTKLRRLLRTWEQRNVLRQLAKQL